MDDPAGSRAVPPGPSARTAAVQLAWIAASGLLVVCFDLLLDAVAGADYIVMAWPAAGLVAGAGARCRRNVALAAGIGVTAGALGLQLLGGRMGSTPALSTVVLGATVTLLVLGLRWAGVRTIDRPERVARLVAVSVVVAALGAAAVALWDRGTPGLDLEGLSAGSWFFSVLWGATAIAPAAMADHLPRGRSSRRWLEYATALAATAAITWYLFEVVTVGSPGLLGWPYLLIVSLGWLAVRFGVAGVAPPMAAASAFGTMAVASGSGVLVAGAADTAGRLTVAQLFFVVIAVAALLLATLSEDRDRSLRQFTETSRLVHEVIEASDAPIFAKTYDDPGRPGRYVLANAAWSSAAGQAPGAAEGQTDHDLFDHDVAEAILANDLAVLAANVARRDEGLMGPPDAPEKPVVVTTFPLRRDDGTAWGIGGIVTDVSELAAARGAEARQAGRLAAVFAASPTPLMRIEMRGPGEWTVLDVNDAFRRTLQGTLPERPSDTVAGMLSSDDLALTRAVVLEAWGRPAAGAATSRTRREIAVTTQDGRTVWVLLSAAPVGPPDADGGREIIVQLEDVSARREAERALSHQALTDAVTGLPNRNALTDRLEASLARLRRTPSTTCILFCDVDHFKVVNDTLGHLAGDAFLGEVARRLTAGTDATDLVARIGGDEFVVLLESVNEPTDAVLVAHRLKDEIARSWAHEGHVFHLTVSMGVATTGDPDASIDDLLRRADIAMYRAKDRGRDRVEMYDQSFDEELGHALTMQQWLREALSGDGLVLHYQPVVSLTDGRVVGAEALLRMRGPDGALVPPVEFLPHAEASGLITRVGAWVLDQALVDLRQWHDRGLDHTLAINVSPTQLNQEGFAADLLARVREAGVDPGSLCVEVTETVLVQDDDRVSGVLSQLHDAGVRIALDDFGTGYSSLSWLLEFPVDLVKIDRSFVRDLGVDVRRTAIVEAVLQVSHRTGLRVVAEGIETQDQADRLLEMGCRLGQGYLLGRPVPLTEPPWAPDLAGAPPSDAAARP